MSTHFLTLRCISLHALLLITGCVMFAFLFAFRVPAGSAVSLSPGDLIKGPTDVVYYYGQDGKRYVFPNAKTYFTWYGDFSTVKTISVEMLASLPIGGNVTYRPGVKLVKITTDPKVYAVSSYGFLRWITTEAVAAQLYGPSWNKQISDVPDAFFTNYRVGDPITSKEMFNPSDIASQSPTIQDNFLPPMVVEPLNLLQPPAPVSTPAVPPPTPAPIPPPSPPPSALLKGSVGIPTNLPNHFGFGLISEGPSELEWMKSSGVPWDYRYQYLTSGLNTGKGWATAWQSSSLPPGQYAKEFMAGSDSGGYIPVFTYYQLVPSKPHPVDGEPDVNLNNAATMKAYYEEWKFLMQKCAEFNKRVIVHVEPDLSGYMQQQHGSNPANAPVAVASSGFAEATGLPNNAIGFAQLLVKMRDLYAPKVLLAWHVSNWATNKDAVSKYNDPVALGKQVVDFYSALHANYDLLFFDPSDRTAAYYEILRGNKNHWWDDAAFIRQRQYIATITGATGKKAMLWQMPIGNTLYRSMNNTAYHYQDNKAQYFLQSGNSVHIKEYVDAGVIGILFGPGIKGDTTNYDLAKDGVTNPVPINGNNLEAKYADDDGGFLRVSASAYYTGGTIKLGLMTPAPVQTTSPILTVVTPAPVSTPLPLASSPTLTQTPTPAITTNPLACPDAKTLESLVTCIVSHFESFVPPSTTEQSAFRQVLKSMLNGACETIPLPLSLTGIYTTRSFKDSDTAKTYCTLVEVKDADGNGKVDRGWGTVIVDNAPKRELNIAITHPIDDWKTEEQGIGVFKGTASRTFFLAGARRNVGTPSMCQPDSAHSSSDAAHNTAMMLFGATQELDAWYGSKTWHQLQFHGMSTTACPGVDIYITNGKNLTPISGDKLLAFKTNILSKHPTWSVTVPGDASSCGLHASTNVQGRSLNGVVEENICTTAAKTVSQKFFSIEQTPDFRKATDWIDAIQVTWPAL